MSVRHAHDLHKLDTTTMLWSLINTGGTAEAPVSLWHDATVIGTKMFVFESQMIRMDPNDYSNNIRVFDTETNCWLSNVPSRPLQPGEFYHSVVAYNRELYIVCEPARGTEEAFSDVWKLNPQSHSWTKLQPRGKGPSFGWYRPSCFMLGDRMFFFGGHGHFSTTYNDELFVLDLSPSLKTLCKLAVIQFNMEQSALPHNIRWELAAMSNYKFTVATHEK